mmetsp:Transcript_28896/g.82792  ORF Transcript_28896/g.82792 Transcript_28896/m.82792 type:complete len:253 (+) Transcript_28896:112-870(+)
MPRSVVRVACFICWPFVRCLSRSATKVLKLSMMCRWFLLLLAFSKSSLVLMSTSHFRTSSSCTCSLALSSAKLLFTSAEVSVHCFFRASASWASLFRRRQKCESSVLWNSVWRSSRAMTCCCSCSPWSRSASASGSVTDAVSARQASPSSSMARSRSERYSEKAWLWRPTSASSTASFPIHSFLRVTRLSSNSAENSFIRSCWRLASPSVLCLMASSLSEISRFLSSYSSCCVLRNSRARSNAASMRPWCFL